MVWIHGGAYVIGYSGQKIYDGRVLSETGNIVVVTLNYRLGALGFLDLSSFSTAADTFESNLGLRDQIAALEWVRDCIGDFGGDPDEVTLFGESSGGGSVTTLMIVPRAEGLFHRAIAQSPPATSVYGRERAAMVAERFLEILDVSSSGVGRLRQMPYEQLVEAAETVVGEIPTKVPGTLAMTPVVDRDLVPKYPVAAFQKGLSHRVPLIIGSNKDEPSIFRFMKSPLMPVDDSAVRAMLEALAKDRPDLEPERSPRSPRRIPTCRSRVVRWPCRAMRGSGCRCCGLRKRMPSIPLRGCTGSTTRRRCSRRRGSVPGMQPNCRTCSVISGLSVVTRVSGSVVARVRSRCRGGSSVDGWHSPSMGCPRLWTLEALAAIRARRAGDPAHRCARHGCVGSGRGDARGVGDQVMGFS